MDYDEHKFAELVVYVAQRLQGDPAGGAVKVNKVLFYAEFGHMRAHGRPITGAEYFRLPQGPAPRRLVPVRDRLIARGDLQQVKSSYLGMTQHRLIPLRDPDLSLFTDDEIETVEQALAALLSLTGAAASDMSHEEIGWQMVEERETIPFEAAYLRPPVITDAIRARAKELAVKRGIA